jgi:hypothetical protein
LRSPRDFEQNASSNGSVGTTPTDYRGWRHSYLLSNGTVEAVVVPLIGRIMQFRLCGEQQGALWTNDALEGRVADPKSSEWMNFGGDKAWPAPQSDWEGVARRAWPPPAGFDSIPFEAKVDRGAVVLTSAVDPDYGIQVVRRIRLNIGRPAMVVGTEYHKVIGAAVRLAVWVITQLRDPAHIFVLLPEKSSFDTRFKQLMGPAPRDLRIDGKLLSLARDPGQCTKIGTEGSRVLWMGRDHALCIESSDASGEYPDSGSKTEIYTNPDPMPYVEIETMGPLATLNVGDRVEQTNTYTLVPRSLPDETREAQRIFGTGVS